MTQPTTPLYFFSIILNKLIHSIKGIDHRRMGIFSETIRDGFDLETIVTKPENLKPEIIAILKDPGAEIDGGNP